MIPLGGTDCPKEVATKFLETGQRKPSDAASRRGTSAAVRSEARPPLAVAAVLVAFFAISGYLFLMEQRKLAGVGA